MKEQIEIELIEIGKFLGAKLSLVSLSEHERGNYDLVIAVNDKKQATYLIPKSNCSLKVSLTYSVIRVLVWQ